jgi:hypothetical protein
MRMATGTGPAKKPKKTGRIRLNPPGATIKPSVSPSREGKVRKEFCLNPELLREAQEYLGAANEREAVEMALDLIAFRRELAKGARTLRKLTLSRID